MADIRKYKLADYIDSFGDGIHGTPNYDENGEYYFINGNNLKNGKIEITSNTLKISSDEYKRIKRNLSDNTLLISINGTLGNIAFYNNEKIALGKSACFLNLNKCACRPFIRYVLESKEFKTYMNRVAGQSTIKNVSPTQVSEYEFFAPSYSDQARIAKVLSTIDREITINREINRNLEELAKQIYDYWFVQFDFPNEEGKPYKSSGGKMVWNETLKREIPADWEVKKLNACLKHINTGLNPRDNFVLGNGTIKYITVKNLTTDGTIDFSGCDLIDENARTIVHERSKISKGDILFASISPLGRCYIMQEQPEKWDINESVFSIRPNQKIITPEYLYCYLTSEWFMKKAEKEATGSIFAGIRMAALNAMTIIVPDEKVLKRFSSLIKPIFEQKDKLFNEIQHLTKLRDKLLPLLMNGQVTLNSCLSAD